MAQIELLIQTIRSVQFSFLLFGCNFHNVDQRAYLARLVCDRLLGSHIVIIIGVVLELALAELTSLFGALSSATVRLPGVHAIDVDGRRVRIVHQLGRAGGSSRRLLATSTPSGLSLALLRARIAALRRQLLGGEADMPATLAHSLIYRQFLLRYLLLLLLLVLIGTPTVHRFVEIVLLFGGVEHARVQLGGLRDDPADAVAVA